MTAASRVADFDTWKPGYQNASVQVFVAGTTTLAPIWSDQAATIPLANPQTLTRLDISGGVGNGGVSYGKWAQPVYCAVGYSMLINSTDQTGIERPKLTSVANEIADTMQVKSTRGTQYRALKDRHDNIVHALDFGTLSALSSAANTATLTAAIGAASGQGGGTVKIPAGTYLHSSGISLPANVVLEGESRAATILQCPDGANVWTLAGDRAGFRRITLDGIQLQANSQGVYGKGVNSLTFDDVLVKRYANGIRLDGSRRNHWRAFDVDNCINGAVLHGDTLALSGGGGDEFTDNEWAGGKVSTCTGIGVELAWVTTYCRSNLLQLDFDSNTGTALKINGARNTILRSCYFTANVNDLTFVDGTDVTKAAQNTVIGFLMQGGGISAGIVIFNNKCQNVRFSRVDFATVSFQCSIPVNEIVFEDCTEDSGVVISGDGTKIGRVTSNNASTTAGITTDANPTLAWSYLMAPGQVLFGRVIGIANQQNGINQGTMERTFRAKQPGAALAYDTRTAAFTVGDIVTGATSGAKGRITADAAGVSGTLTIRSITGTFIDRETLADQHTGLALAVGTQAVQASVVVASATVGADSVDVAYNVTITASGQSLRVNVIGVAATNVEWSVSVDVKSSI